jgi:hypothetical protein
MAQVTEPPARLSKVFAGHPFRRMPQIFRIKVLPFLLVPLTLRP